MAVDHVGEFVRVRDEAGLFRVAELRGERVLVRGLVRLPIQPTMAVAADDVLTLCGVGELSAEEAAQHSCEIWRDAIGEQVRAGMWCGRWAGAGYIPAGVYRVLGADLPDGSLMVRLHIGQEGGRFEAHVHAGAVQLLG